jgi:hypothetical protein
MSLKGKWRIVEMQAWERDFLDLAQPAYILFGETSGEFAFGCVTGSFGGVSEHNAIAFDWGGADAMDEAHGDGWAELQDDGTLVGEISFHNGDESGFIARRWETSSTAC